MILTQLPDLPPRPQTEGNANFRRRFYSRWGRENAIVCGRSLGAEYATMTQTLSVKLAWGGRERYRLRGRDLVVDEDNYAILNEGSTYGSVLHASRLAWTFAVFFRPGMQHEVHSARRLCCEDVLEGAVPKMRWPGFSEHLRQHDQGVTPKLRQLFETVLDGVQDELWLEEQLLLLLDEMFLAEEESGRQVDRLSRAKASTRLELARRLRLAADLMQSDFDAPLDLETIGKAACMSKFHLVRYFRELHGMTPHAYLLRKRTAAARRLIQLSDSDLSTVAVKTGFGCVTTLRRALARAPR